MTYIYEVRDMHEGKRFPPLSVPKSLVVLWYRDRILPKRGEVQVLHGKHANRSQLMIWDERASTFTCVECGQVIGVSDRLFQDILGMISNERYSTLNLIDEGMQLQFALLVKEFPEAKSLEVCAVAHEV